MATYNIENPSPKMIEVNNLWSGDGWYENQDYFDQTVEEAEKESGMVFMPCTDYSDWYKEIHGFRPRGYALWWSAQEWEAEQEWLSKQSEIAAAEAEAAQKYAISKFENVISLSIQLGAKTRERALEWLKQNYSETDLMYGDEYIEYDFGLPYGYIKGKGVVGW